MKYALAAILVFMIAANSPAQRKNSVNNAVEVLSMERVENAYPLWSKDGKRILFVSASCRSLARMNSIRWFSRSVLVSVDILDRKLLYWIYTRPEAP